MLRLVGGSKINGEIDFFFHEVGDAIEQQHRHGYGRVLSRNANTIRYAEIAFTPTVKRAQGQLGSRNAYARMEGAPETRNHPLSETEAQFIAARSSFYIATVSETGWPYIQHRGGPTGFVRVLDDATIGFTEFRGNWQYISLGSLVNDDRVRFRSPGHDQFGAGPTISGSLTGGLRPACFGSRSATRPSGSR